MPKIIGVRFRNTGKVYYFDPGDFTIHYHDHVVVETARGVEYGTVVITPTDMPEGKIAGPLKKVIRMATKEDDERDEANREREKEAYHVCKQRIAERGLDMKLIGAEYTFDNSKVLFYFTADGRIDFRELVKDLAGIFRTRIELRQIGVRDETKLLGGIGSCGRPLCCHTWLSEFAPVSIKMAKDQNLSLNPAKISGTCGRLMCCLKNEADTYAYLNRSMPGKGDLVTTPDGLQGDVVSVNILRQTVKVIVETGDDEKELREFEVKDITFIPKSKRPKKEQQGQPKNKGEKPDKSERPDRSEKPDKSLRPDKGEKPDRSEKPDKGEKTDRSEKPDRSEKTDKGVKAASESKDKASGGTEKEAPKSKETEAADKKEKSAAEGEKKKRRRRRPRHKTQKAEETAERPAKQDAPQG
jgi:cell fate regulator YaaT (PSP1 superfamily)